MMQALMRILYAGGSQDMGALGSGGSFTSDPAADVNQQLQVGNPLEFGSSMSPTGMNSNYMSTVKGIMGNNPMMGMSQPFTGGGPLQGGVSSRNSQPGGEGFSAALQPHSPGSFAQTLMSR
jgi:hypothetical protein